MEHFGQDGDTPKEWSKVRLRVEVEWGQGQDHPDPKHPDPGRGLPSGSSK